MFGGDVDASGKQLQDVQDRARLNRNCAVAYSATKNDVEFDSVVGKAEHVPQFVFGFPVCRSWLPQ